MNNSLFDMSNCILCPRECHVDRAGENTGFCGQKDTVSIARAALHMWEEPCISGTNGSGAVFFSGCNIRCVFCQNADLSESRFGKEVSVSTLADIFLSLQDQNAHNINLITAGHFVPQIKSAIIAAKNNGLTIPIVYNTGSYEKAEVIHELDGLVDIYLPDLKYYSPKLSARLSSAPDYFDVASKAILEMYRQTGPNVFDENSIMKKGTLVRHLVLPGHIEDSRRLLKYLFETYGNNIYVSIMNQYTPMPSTSHMHDLNHTLSKDAYDRLIDYCLGLGYTNAYIQDGETCKESFIPAWDYTGIPN